MAHYLTISKSCPRQISVSRRSRISHHYIIRLKGFI